MNKYNIHSIKKILLAAGSSKRYGTENKLSALINGKSVINHTLDALLKTFHHNEIIVVVGHDFQNIINLINNPKINYVKNQNYKNGMGTSISSAMKKIDSYTDGVMIIPGDMPFITIEDLIKLERKFLELKCTKVVCPKHNGIIGNPVLLPKSYFKILESLNDDIGAKPYIKDKDLSFVHTNFGTNFDVDTVENLIKAKRL
ncbi:nucleotidyltransferase family protein [Alphaproteobacteria bacterium]|jgi:molybdenum cofactor cytidylyltransferase|nr:nucleotidyltransferase family protein [Alphaproteobacteria bacterium]